MAVWYLDNADEITDAVARLRGATDERVVFVVPPGSRIATGRINFKLLAREAESRDLHMAIASPDEQVRAMAGSAGVLAFGTAAEAEAALERGDPAPEPTKAAVAVPDDHDGGASTGQHGGRGTVFGRNRRRLGITTVSVLAVAIVGGYAALQTFPTAEITLALRVSALGPIEVPVTASTAITEPDVASGRIPAIEHSIALEPIERTFQASGLKTVSEPATGEVLFSSLATFQDIAAGTRVKTPSGIEFQTTELVTLAQPAEGEGPGMVTAPIVAVAAGADGNALAGEITVVSSLEDQGISVTNPEPMAGGSMEETLQVTAQDYNAAAADLKNRLGGALDAYLRDPATTPEGLTFFAQTKQLGPVTYLPPAGEVVGSDFAEFTLSGSVDASVLAVDEQLVDEVTRARLLEAVPEGMSILVDSVSVTTGEGSPDGERIRFTGIATADSYRPVDDDAILEQVAGLPISEARAILEAIGTTTVNVWPEFLGDLPGDTSRITLDVLRPSTTE
jgi:hypothetical protein